VERPRRRAGGRAYLQGARPHVLRRLNVQRSRSPASIPWWVDRRCNLLVYCGVGHEIGGKKVWSGRSRDRSTATARDGLRSESWQRSLAPSTRETVVQVYRILLDSNISHGERARRGACTVAGRGPCAAAARSSSLAVPGRGQSSWRGASIHQPPCPRAFMAPLTHLPRSTSSSLLLSLCLS
jgi:hypothetical protein